MKHGPTVGERNWERLHRTAFLIARAFAPRGSHFCGFACPAPQNGGRKWQGTTLPCVGREGVQAASFACLVLQEREHIDQKMGLQCQAELRVCWGGVPEQAHAEMPVTAGGGGGHACLSLVKSARCMNAYDRDFLPLLCHHRRIWTLCLCRVAMCGWIVGGILLGHCLKRSWHSQADTNHRAKSLSTSAGIADVQHTAQTPDSKAMTLMGQVTGQTVLLVGGLDWWFGGLDWWFPFTFYQNQGLTTRPEVAASCMEPLKCGAPAVPGG